MDLIIFKAARYTRGRARIRSIHEMKERRWIMETIDDEVDRFLNLQTYLSLCATNEKD
jgi:hypothetical protein